MTNNTTCTLFGGDEFKCNVIIALKRTTGSLSLIGCTFMISTIWLFRKYNILSQRLILCLSVGASMDAIGYMMGYMTTDGPLCDFEAWWMSYFDWTVLMWVTCITFNLFFIVVKRRRTEGFEKYYHLASWVAPPLLFSLIPFIGDNYGPAGAWCWIKHDSKAWRFAVWYVPLFLAILGLFVVYFYIIYLLRRRLGSWQGNYDPNAERDNMQIKEDIKVLKAIHNAVTEEGNDIYGLWILTAITGPLQGAVNAVVFGLDPDTRSKLTWTNIQLAWASHFNSTTIREYPTVPGGIAKLDETPQFDSVDHDDFDVAQRNYVEGKLKPLPLSHDTTNL